MCLTDLPGLLVGTSPFGVILLYVAWMSIQVPVGLGQVMLEMSKFENCIDAENWLAICILSQMGVRWDIDNGLENISVSFDVEKFEIKIEKRVLTTYRNGKQINFKIFENEVYTVRANRTYTVERENVRTIKF